MPAAVTPADDVAALLARARQRDAAATGELYRRTVGPVYRYVFARVGRADEAEEITQEVFMAAVAGIESLRADDETGLLAWLFQVARHKMADAIRRRARHPTEPLEHAALVASPLPDPAEPLLRADDQAEVRACLDELTPEQREVLLCKYALDYDNAETARQLGRTIGAVNQLHHRALARLASLLGERR